MRNVLIALLLLATPAAAEDWLHFEYARLGISCDYPPALRLDPADGQTFRSLDGKVTLRVFGFPNDGHRTAAELLDGMLRSVENPLKEARVYTFDFVGGRGKDIVSTQCLIGATGNVGCVELTEAVSVNQDHGTTDWARVSQSLRVR